MPGYLLLEGTPYDTITTAINTMVSGMASAATGLITTNVPIIAPVVGGIVLVSFGFRFARRFMG